ncbi:hypothetical protein ACFQ0B_12275 [Nonomuraea thailandensis]
MSSARGWRSFALDGALAAVVAALLSLTALATPGAGALDLAAVLVASAALLAWRRAPWWRWRSPRCACWCSPRTPSRGRPPPSPC